MSKNATVTDVPEQMARAMKTTGVWQQSCPVPLSRLSLIKARYVDFDGNTHDDGEMVALDVVAEPIAELLGKLFEIGFPITKIKPLHIYSGDDEQSMEDNNTSCFCFRPMLGTDVSSLHSYGVALDINPVQNPYLTIDQEHGLITCHPKTGWQYLNRYNKKAGMVENIVPLFARYGLFEWGGRWTSPLDYHHFQMPRALAELLVALTPEDGKRLLAMAIQNQEKLLDMPSGKHIQDVLNLYHTNKSEFFEKWIGLLGNTM